VFDARNARRARRVKGRDGISFARFSPDGRLVAVGDAHGGTEVWSTTTWRPVTRPLVGQNGSVESAAISSDDRTLVTASQDGTLRLWDIATGKSRAARRTGSNLRRRPPTLTGSPVLRETSDASHRSTLSLYLRVNLAGASLAVRRGRVAGTITTCPLKTSTSCTCPAVTPRPTGVHKGSIAGRPVGISDRVRAYGRSPSNAVDGYVTAGGNHRSKEDA
jgi:WD40 repeat protein